MSQDTTVLVCCHKKDYWYDGPGFLPIQVGKALSNIDLGIQGDNTGDNISSKNPNYCELTAHYWYWKNGNKTKYIGLCHYRRYFSFELSLPFPRSLLNINESQIKTCPPILPDLDFVFEDCDIILAKPYNTPFSLETEYKVAHIANDLQILRNVIADKYSICLPVFDELMKYNNKLSTYNMFITKNSTFEEYSNWLFDILFEVERRVKISSYADQARIFGYMSERLLNVFVRYKKLRVTQMPVIKIDESPNIDYYKILLCYLRNELSARLTYSRK